MSNRTFSEEEKASNDSPTEYDQIDFSLTRKRSRLSSIKEISKLEEFRSKLKHKLNISSLTERKRVEIQSAEEGVVKGQQIFHIIQESDEGRAYRVLEKDFWEYYKKKTKLGEGTTGVVFKCKELSTGKIVAVKCVRTRDEELIFMMENEFKCISKLKHPNVIQVFDMVLDRTQGWVYIIMEYFQGKEMFEVLAQNPYTEEQAKKIFKEVLTSIMFLHANGVIHRDLKPNNILVDEGSYQTKIADFNVAKFSEKYKDYSDLKKSNYQMTTYTGTVAFSAPEIFAGHIYSEMVDCWSAGCVLYTMLCGYQPFYTEYLKDLIELIKAGKYEFPDEPWKFISSEAKELISKLLQIDSETRLTPKEALAHPWLTVLLKFHTWHWCYLSLLNQNRGQVYQMTSSQSKTSIEAQDFPNTTLGKAKTLVSEESIELPEKPKLSDYIRRKTIGGVSHLGMMRQRSSPIDIIENESSLGELGGLRMTESERKVSEPEMRIYSQDLLSLN